MSDSTQIAKQQEAPKSPVSSGGALAAMAPQNLDDAFRLAKALAMAGDMVPQHFQNKPEATMAAIIRGMEIGLAPMQALSNIAVINGRASVWGDALPAMMQRAGHSIDVDVQGEGDQMIATAVLTRGDTGKSITRTFSAADAKKAGLWSKKGPWQQYPKRMLSLRARSLACRDGAADALMGLQVAEEMRDVPPMRNVTPEAQGGWAQQAQQARGEVMPADEKPQETIEDPTIEDVTMDQPEGTTAPADQSDGELPHWTVDIDPSWGDADSDEWAAGRQALANDAPYTDNPHENDMDQAASWAAGWIEANEGEGA